MTIQSAESNLFLDAARAAGGEVVFDWKDFGYVFLLWRIWIEYGVLMWRRFAAFVPKHVVELMRRYGREVGVRVFDNACLAVPDCGEEPC